MTGSAGSFLRSAPSTAVVVVVHAIDEQTVWSYERFAFRALGSSRARPISNGWFPRESWDSTTGRRETDCVEAATGVPRRVATINPTA